MFNASFASSKSLSYSSFKLLSAFLYLSIFFNSVLSSTNCLSFDLSVSAPFNESFASCNLAFAASTSACVTFSFANTALASSTALL